jgi:hypothetical protein
VKIFSRLLPSAFDPLNLALLAVCVWAVLLGSCSQTPVTVRLHAMQTSGRVSFVCRGLDNSPSGHKLDECPDYEHATRHTLALVTQTATNEVAVVDLYAQSIVDIDQTTPGYSFLRVGAQPGAIVTTPGGAATFVGVSGLQKNGIFALPTTCVLPPQEGEAARDLTSWPACHLSSAPGDILVVVDPQLDKSGAQRTSCLGVPPTEPRVDGCLADLTKESGPVGRRKLLVALPDEHKLVLLDAQRLLDRPPGSFGECEPEATFALNADVPTTPVSPVPPEDGSLKIDSGTDTSACVQPSYPPSDASALPTPGGLAAMGDRVYVADRTKPVVHVLDVSDPCTDTELPPLLPYSYSAPNRVVTTSRVAVSPVSPQGKQYVYAIDQDDQPTASVMVFDLRRIAENAGKDDYRTPLVFDGTPRQPYMPADRLRFSAPVRDISFVMRDFPKPDPETGAGEFGLSCDPDPGSNGPGTAYRSNSDFTDGARPINLRGLFGFAMLTNGQVAVIDAEDFDEPCRRPVTTNTGDVEDLHGCKKDKIGTPYTLDGVPTVTNESSCHIVEPHRPRSAALSISSSSNGLHAPSLRAFPQFSNPNPAEMITVDQQPRMLATDFDDPASEDSGVNLPAEVNVSTQLYAHCTNKGPPPCDGTAQPLEIDPKQTGAPNSLALPLIEPRSYAQDEAPTLVFEGRLFNDRTSGFLDLEPGKSVGVLRDPDANFCAAGVEDSETIRPRGEAFKIPSANLDAWAKAHADYVQITGDFPAEDDAYWLQGHGKDCAGLFDASKPNAGGREACSNAFGNIDNPAVLKTSRDLSILNASAGFLTVEPRTCPFQGCVRGLEQLSCCFPAGTAYTVRASNQWLLNGTAGLHDIAAGADGRCVHTASCDRRKQYYNQRAFEVCDSSAPPETHIEKVFEDGVEKDVIVTDFQCAVSDPKVGCVAANPKMGGDPDEIPVQPGSTPSACIFDSLTSHFVVYHGAKSSFRGMTFSWQTTGGFVPQSMSLLSQSNSVSPQSLASLPELGFLAVVDASTLGLVLFDLNSLGVVFPSPYF